MDHPEGTTPAAPRHRVAKGAIGTLLVKGGGSVVILLSNLVLARTLGARGYGVYVYAISWVVLLGVPCLLGLDTLIVREIAADRACGRWGLVTGLIRWSAGLAGAVSVVVALAAGGLALLLSGGRWTPPVVVFWLCLPLLPLSTVAAVLRSAVSGLHRVVLGQIPTLLVRPAVFLLAVLAFIGLCPARFGAGHAAVLHDVAAAVTLAFLAVLLWRTLPAERRRHPPAYDRGRWLRSALPLVLLGGAQVVLARSDAIMLGAMSGPEAAGIYVLANRIAAALSFLLMALNASLAPVAAELWALGEKRRLQEAVTRAFQLLTPIAIAGVLVFVFFGRQILSVFGPEFPEGYSALVVLAVANALNVAIGPVGLVLNMARRERDVLQAVGGAAIANLVLNAILIPSLGVLGAAVATGVSMAGWNLALLVRMRQRTGLSPIPWRAAGRPPRED